MLMSVQSPICLQRRMEEQQTAVLPVSVGHQCRVLMVNAGLLAASISTTSEAVVISTEVDLKANKA